MKFLKKKVRYSNPTWHGTKNKVKFIVAITGESYYVVLNKGSVRLNTLWMKLTFNSFEQATNWCEEFKLENFKDHCLGE